MFSPTSATAPPPLPGLRQGVILLGDGDDSELRDLQLGQVIRLGEAAALIVRLLDGKRNADELLHEATELLGEEVNPVGLVELLQALDQRALLDTPRARMMLNQGLVRADMAALHRLGQRDRQLSRTEHGESPDTVQVQVGPSSKFSCHACGECCSETQTLGPISAPEREAIMEGFKAAGEEDWALASRFIPVPTSADEPLYLLRPEKGYCNFLEPDNSCRIHRVLGPEVKPAVCRLFPFRPVHTPAGWDVGLDLACPSVATGSGDEPTTEAESVLRGLFVINASLPAVPTSIQLVANGDVDYADYRAWERSALETLGDEQLDPVEAWLGAVSTFCESTASPEVDEDDLDQTVEFAETNSNSASMVPLQGVGTMGSTPAQATDILLRDLALWSELLIGLEPRSPLAFRRFRSALVRLRGELAETPDAAPVLSEKARRKQLDSDQADSIRTRKNPTKETIQATRVQNASKLPTLKSDDPEVLRRFLVQMLVEKFPFHFGTIGRGLIAMSLFVAVLRLNRHAEDALHPSLDDVTFLTKHEHLGDILDTRATLRAAEGNVEVHRHLLN